MPGLRLRDPGLDVVAVLLLWLGGGVMSLSNEERAAVASLVVYLGIRSAKAADIAALTVDQIATARADAAVRAALAKAVMQIETSAQVCESAHGIECIGGIAYRDAASLVRAAIPTPSRPADTPG